MMKVLLPTLLFAALVTPTLAQQSEPVKVTWTSSAEYSAYMTLYGQTIAANRASSAEKALAERSDASPVFLTAVYKMMFLGYVEAGNSAKVIDSYNRMNLAPNLTDAEKQEFKKLAEEAKAKLKK